jgi:endoribonuclease Dicer
MCISSGIYRFVDAGAHRLGDALQRFASAVTAKHEEEHRIAKRESRSPGQYWLDIDCPKVSLATPGAVSFGNVNSNKAVSDIMEAILGALYVSENCNLVGAEKFFDDVFKPFYETYITFKSLSRHATNTVLELLQKRRCNQYRLLKHDRNGQTLCRGKLKLFVYI